MQLMNSAEVVLCRSSDVVVLALIFPTSMSSHTNNYEMYSSRLSSDRALVVPIALVSFSVLFGFFRAVSIGHKKRARAPDEAESIWLANSAGG